MAARSGAGVPSYQDLVVALLLFAAVAVLFYLILVVPKLHEEFFPPAGDHAALEFGSLGV